MPNTHLLLRYGELFLKGGNVSWFEKKLIENLHQQLGINRFKRLRGRLILDYFEEHASLQQVFGLVSYSPALKVEKELEAIKTAVLQLLRLKKGSFKIETNRSDKTFPLKSPELNALLGKLVEEKNKQLTFDLKSPLHRLYLEINRDGVYLFTEIIPGAGGLPSGTGGKVAVLLENKNSLLACWLIMKRGCSVYPVGFKEESSWTEKDLSLLQNFSPVQLKLNLISDWQELELFMLKNGLEVLVSGQRFEEYQKYNTSLIVLRPLVAYGEKEIEETFQNARSD